jgi:hypothetical protein
VVFTAHRLCLQDSLQSGISVRGPPRA